MLRNVLEEPPSSADDPGVPKAAPIPPWRFGKPLHPQRVLRHTPPSQARNDMSAAMTRRERKKRNRPEQYSLEEQAKKERRRERKVGNVDRFGIILVDKVGREPIWPTSMIPKRMVAIVAARRANLSQVGRQADLMLKRALLAATIVTQGGRAGSS